MKRSFWLKLCENILLFLSGGLTYGLLEILWRRRTHISMVITGGICFLSLFHIFRKFRNLKLLQKCVIGSALITTFELICGLIVNLALKLNVWDYSHLRFNFLGQISLLYSFLWGLLTIPISFICSKITSLNLRLSSKQKQRGYDCF